MSSRQTIYECRPLLIPVIVVKSRLSSRIHTYILFVTCFYSASPPTPTRILFSRIFSITISSIIPPTYTARRFKSVFRRINAPSIRRKRTVTIFRIIWIRRNGARLLIRNLVLYTFFAATLATLMSFNLSSRKRKLTFFGFHPFVVLCPFNDN